MRYAKGWPAVAGLGVVLVLAAGATRPVGTTVRLSASGGRSAVWSGACATSSKASSCTFTVGGDATVNANVQ